MNREEGRRGRGRRKKLEKKGGRRRKAKEDKQEDSNRKGWRNKDVDIQEKEQEEAGRQEQDRVQDSKDPATRRPAPTPPQPPATSGIPWYLPQNKSCYIMRPELCHPGEGTSMLIKVGGGQVGEERVGRTSSGVLKWRCDGIGR